MTPDEIVERCRLPPGKRFRMDAHDPGWAPTAELKHVGKDEAKERAKELLELNLASLTEAQQLLYADGRYAAMVRRVRPFFSFFPSLKRCEQVAQVAGGNPKYYWRNGLLRQPTWASLDQVDRVPAQVATLPSRLACSWDSEVAPT